MTTGDSPKPLRADAARNRARLLGAARAAFTSGQAQVSLESVAKEAGVGIGTLYRHFPTREALVEALYREELTQLCSSAGELLASTDDPEEALRRWMDRFADYATVKREMADALRTVLASGRVAVSQSREQLATAVGLILDAGSEAGILRADVRAADVVVSVVGMCSATSLPDDREQLDRMLDLLAAGVRVGTTNGNPPA